MSMTTALDWGPLVQTAIEVQKNAYAPYSHYRVGAVVLAPDGQVFAGCNVENATYGLTVCAERTAVVSMVAAGCQNIAAVVVVTQGTRAGSPCGLCRQTLAEFCEDAPILLIAIDALGEVQQQRMTSVAALLPEPFRGDLVRTQQYGAPPQVDDSPKRALGVRVMDSKKGRSHEPSEGWLIQGGVIVTCSAQHDVLSGDVAIENNTIVGIGPDAQTKLKGSFRVLDARGCAVLPGLVQAHVHLVQTLFRGLAEERPLLCWLKQCIWPLEAAHDEASLVASAELGLSEMLRAGTTSILDMGTVHGHDAVFDACARSGIRALSGKAMMDVGEGVPKRLRESTRSSLGESEALAKRWSGAAEGRLRYAYCPRFVLSCSEKLIRNVAEISASTGALVHTHAAEHAEERKTVRTLLGKDDIAALASWGVTGTRAVLAHGVYVRNDEIKALARVGTRIVHCPSANLKLGSGIARVATMHKAGVCVGLGADGAACNNNLDPWQEMRHAGLLASVRTGVASLSARAVLHMVTLEGATVLGLRDKIGSLEIGKCADVIIVAIDDIHTAPAVDLFATLVYACQSRDVRYVLVDGRLLVEHGETLTLDRQRVAARAREEALRIGKKAGVL